jgi:hypothetical protein
MFKKIGLMLFISMILSVSCQQSGKSIKVFASAEEIANSGFTTVDGWDITISSLLVSLSDITLIDADGVETGSQDNFVTELINQDESLLVPVTEITGLKGDNYPGIGFSITQSDVEPMDGHSMVITGIAEQGDVEQPFIIQIDNQINWKCTEGYVGDVLKGYISDSGSGEHEITFHIDHIFGDSELDEESHVNTAAVGFSFFLPGLIENDGVVNSSYLEKTSSEEDFMKFTKTVSNLGHSGEGHAEATQID